MRYRKRPIIIEAVQFKDGKLSEVPEWVSIAIDDNTLFRMGRIINITTTDGTEIVHDTDFIVKDTDGQLHRYSESEFSKLHEQI